MKMTSAQAAKAVRKLNEEHSALLQKERLSSTFLAASGEDPESLRPAYDYADTQAKIAAVEKKLHAVVAPARELLKELRALKHAVNIFNSTHTVPGFDMTVDELLIYIPQLNARVSKLAEMKAKLPKMRVEERYGKTSNIIDYTYTNYDIDAACADYEKAADELARAQLALDTLNTTEVFDVEF